MQRFPVATLVDQRHIAPPCRFEPTRRVLQIDLERMPKTINFPRRGSLVKAKLTGLPHQGPSTHPKQSLDR